MTLESWLLDHEPAIRLTLFGGGLALIALAEILAPRRELSLPKARRWGANIGLVVLNTVVLRLVIPTAAVGAAFVAQEQGWGLFNHLEWGHGVEALAGVLLLDFIIYLQHVMFHAVPGLWALHAVHHADRDFDVTTGARFHPLEILLSMGIKLALVTALGAPPLAVLIFESLLSLLPMFNHANLKLPLGLDRVLRLVVVTPDMHRVHHSVVVGETNSNYGFNVPWWDRLLGTYVPQPEAGHDGMTIGLAEHQTGGVQGIPWMLAMPFRRKRT
jgi:sterol desaturase/sphingolipid hydroxylase (fatty acid hydroxylase superfamily)